MLLSYLSGRQQHISVVGAAERQNPTRLWEDIEVRLQATLVYLTDYVEIPLNLCLQVQIGVVHPVSASVLPNDREIERLRPSVGVDVILPRRLN